MYKNILVPIDLDYLRAGAQSLKIARELAQSNGAALTVINILPDAIADSGDPPNSSRPKLEAFLAMHGASAEIADIIEVGGSVSAEIRSAARKIGADLIVMGARDAEFTDTLIGSNAAHVAIHTPCSVLLVQ